MDFEEVMDLVVKGFELAGVSILIAGCAAAVVSAATALRRGRRGGIYEQVRRDIGRAILLGLEVLIIADIVQTITVQPTVEQALMLGIIVLVRTFLSFSIDIEMEGVAPWRRRAFTAGGAGSADIDSSVDPGADDETGGLGHR